MALTDMLIKEIEKEAAGTKKTLERVPADKFDWQPHQKSMTMKQLATHIVGLVQMTGIAATTDYLDFVEGTMKTPEINSTEDLVTEFDKNTQETIAALKSIKDEDLNKEWVLRAGDHVIVKAPKLEAIRTMALNHTYHHRAQLGVYLRLLDIPVPGVYGPSADDKA